MSRIVRSTNIGAALRARQRGFLLNPFRFAGVPAETLTLKSSGLATAAVMVVAVQGNGSIVEFVSPTVNSQKTVAAQVTTGTSSWKGSTRRYFETKPGASPQDPTWDFYGVTFGSTKPTVNNSGSGNGIGFFAAFAGRSASNGGAPFLFGMDSGTDGWGVDASTGRQRWRIASNSFGEGSTTLPSNGTTKFSIGSNFDGGSATSEHFYGLESGSLASDGTYAPADFGSTGDLVVAIGGSAGNGNFPAKCHIAALFNRELTLSEYQSLHNDWLGTLFDVT